MNEPFPPGVKSIPVPAPLMGGLLAEIDDLTELKVTLRALWHIHQKKGVPRTFRPSDLSGDRGTAAALHAAGEKLDVKVREALHRAAGRGVFVGIRGPDGEELFALNTAPERKGLLRAYPSHDRLHAGEPRGQQSDLAWQGETVKPNLFVVYEQNVGPLTPLIGERIDEARASFPEEWIEDAIRIAVENNARSWNYISAILARWNAEGRADGKPGRDPQEDQLEAYWRAYGRYVRRG